MSQIRKNSPKKSSPLRVVAKASPKKLTPKKLTPKKLTPKKVVKRVVKKATPKKVVKKAGKATPKKRVPKKKSTAPKRPMTAFIIYMKENRDNIKRNHPNATFTEIPKIGAKEWAALKPATKAKYEAMSEVEKKRYANEMSTYVPDPEDKKKKRKRKDPNAPKRPSSAYIFYVISRLDRLRKEKPEFAMPQIMIALGAEWHNMDDRSKRPFQDLSVKDKARYEREMNAYTKA